MARDRRLGEAESADDLADSVISVLQQAENLPARFVREGLEELAELSAAPIEIRRATGEGLPRHVATRKGIDGGG